MLAPFSVDSGLQDSSLNLKLSFYFQSMYGGYGCSGGGGSGGCVPTVDSELFPPEAAVVVHL